LPHLPFLYYLEIRSKKAYSHGGESLAYSDFADIVVALERFRDERNWKQFHNSKDLALAVAIEASELTELFLWKGSDEVDLGKLKEELADVFAFAFLLAAKHGIDVREIVMEKIKKNAEKYPVEKARNSATKYDQL
jgi:NTP pyrophosphatase (non-canonical NTP hydrolase)